MRKKEKNFIRRVATMTALLFVVFCLTSSCTGYNPAFYPSYDVLNPSDAVKENPVGYVEFDDDLEKYVMVLYDGVSLKSDGGYQVVSLDFMMWVNDLKEEIRKLRK